MTECISDHKIIRNIQAIKVFINKAYRNHFSTQSRATAKEFGTISIFYACELKSKQQIIDSQKLWNLKSASRFEAIFGIQELLSIHLAAISEELLIAAVIYELMD